MPCGDRKFELGEIARWLRSSAKPAESDSADARRLKAAEIRKAEAQAAIAETKAKILSGDVVLKERVIAYCATLCSFTRERLQAIPQELCPGFPPEIRDDLRVSLQDKLDYVLLEMSHISTPENHIAKFADELANKLMSSGDAAKLVKANRKSFLKSQKVKVCRRRTP